MTHQHYPPDEWITRTRAAALYGVSTRTIDRLAVSGQIRRVKLPHRLPSVLLAVADLERVLAAQVAVCD